MTSRRTDAGCLAEENIGLRERAAALREECERLAQRAEHYRDLYENSPDMYAVFNSGSTRLVECNETLARFLGYPRDDLIGRSLFSLHAQQDQGRIFDHFLRFLREGEIEDARVRIQHADGRRMPVSVSIAGTRDESGALVEGRVVMRDVTDVAGTEEALEQSEDASGRWPRRWASCPGNSMSTRSKGPRCRSPGNRGTIVCGAGRW